MTTLKQKIEDQITFAQKQEKEAKYLEALKWSGYIQGLEYVLCLLKEK